MIARVWRARAADDAHAAAYADHFERRVLPVLQATDGFLDGQVLERADGDGVALTVVTRWASAEAMRAFAGPEPERAVVEPEAHAVLSSAEDVVELHAVRSAGSARPR